MGRVSRFKGLGFRVLQSIRSSATSGHASRIAYAFLMGSSHVRPVRHRHVRFLARLAPIGATVSCRVSSTKMKTRTVRHHPLQGEMLQRPEAAKYIARGKFNMHEHGKPREPCRWPQRRRKTRCPDVLRSTQTSMQPFGYFPPVQEGAFDVHASWL